MGWGLTFSQQLQGTGSCGLVVTISSPGSELGLLTTARSVGSGA